MLDNIITQSITCLICFIPLSIWNLNKRCREWLTNNRLSDDMIRMRSIDFLKSRPRIYIYFKEQLKAIKNSL